MNLFNILKNDALLRIYFPIIFNNNKFFQVKKTSKKKTSSAIMIWKSIEGKAHHRNSKRSLQ